jgi:hypothetical protein
MPKAALILLADTGPPEGTGRMANALTTAKEFKDAGDDAIVLFDGAGTRWVPELADPEHKYHRLMQEIAHASASVSRRCGHQGRTR